VHVLALSALRTLTLPDIQLLAKILPGGTDLYQKTVKTIKHHPTLLTLTKKLLA